ncbi:MAG TPA: hypothetical protein VD905_05610, partial [Flavobacteriales bacterium]|nr:hypothetical protein [Flavobacteriales bacterium]
MQHSSLLKKVFVAGTFCLGTFLIQAQALFHTETNSPGGEEQNEAVIRSSDNTIVTAGWYYSGTTLTNDLLLTKQDMNGTVIWSRTYADAGGNNEMGIDLMQDAAGNYVVVGNINDGTSFGMLLAKFDVNGNFLFSKKYTYGANASAEGIVQTPDGNYVIAGHTSGGPTTSSILVIKTDQLGDTLWTKNISASGIGEYSHDIVNTPDGGLAIIGDVDVSGTVYHFFLMKLNATGNYQWSNTYSGGLGNDLAYELSVTSDGNFIVTGTSDNYGAVSGDLLIAKLDSTGGVIFSNIYGIGMFNAGYSVQETFDGGFIATGIMDDVGDEAAGFIKVDDTGTIEYAQRFNIGPTGFNEAIAGVVQLSDSSYAFAGNGNNSAVAMRIGKTGNSCNGTAISPTQNSAPYAPNAEVLDYESAASSLTVASESLVQEDVIDIYKACEIWFPLAYTTVTNNVVCQGTCLTFNNYGAT